MYDFIATKVEVLNSDTNQYETFNLVVDGELDFAENDPEVLTDDDLDNINMLLYLKDKFNISGVARREITMKANAVPKTYGIKKRIRKLNSKWNLKAVPGDFEGVQVGFEESLKKHVSRLEQTGTLKDRDTIKVKMNGDGTNIGKRLTVVNFGYTILNERKVAIGEKGNYILAIIKTTESYDNLRQSLPDLIKEMSNLKEINVNGCNYKIEYYLGGDWKLLALVCGVGKANEDYACIWCKCPRTERWNTNKQWEITRTICDIYQRVPHLGRNLIIGQNLCLISYPSIM